MAVTNINLTKAKPNYPAATSDVQAAPQVVVQWDDSFKTATSLTFGLTVTDNLGAVSNQAKVTVTIQAPPQARLPANFTVSQGKNIPLDGSLSTPPPSQGVTYTWTLIS